ncbi:DNA topoisomerase IV subunit B, partial [Streptomyces sp. SID11233]|nr:DNA topoisomerase IV subunit B [Streptomyces sp. SID11233]
HTHEGGTHEEGFRGALTTIVNKYARDKKLLREKDGNLTGDDIREGLTAIISVKLGEPQFEGQTKTKLGNTEARTFVQKIVYERLADWFDRNPNEASD